MKVTYRKSAAKRLIRMEAKRAMAVREAIARIAENPTGQHPNLKPLKGVEDGFRLRLGDWRISFTLDWDEGVVDVFEIEPRGGAYRW